MLAGSLIELSRHQTKLLGGHTSIAEYAGLGFAVTGMTVKPQAQVEPDKASDMTFDLLLTKPLGTGVILAAEMRQLCAADSYEDAVTVMLQSNFQAAQIIAQYPQAVMTDVTGFGLARHALNLTQRVSANGVTLFPETCPFITGALSLSAKGVQSSAFTANQHRLTDSALDPHSPSAKLMFDPQTSGGVLAAVPQTQTRDCLQRLHQAGYSHTTVVGHLSDRPGLQFAKETRAE
jgi:selenide,water dikinase